MELRHFKKAEKNFNLSWKDGMKENLMGLLAGDYSISLFRGAGIHFHCQKKAKISFSKESNGGIWENWNTIIEEVLITGKNGKPCVMEGNAGSLFHVLDLEQQTKISTTNIDTSFVINETNGVFAHMVVPRLIKHHQPNTILNWRTHLPDIKGVTSGIIFRTAVDDAMKCGIVHTVGHQEPATYPLFLSDRGSKSV